jgi:Prealbumin-like fold domain
MAFKFTYKKYLIPSGSSRVQIVVVIVTFLILASQSVPSISMGQTASLHSKKSDTSSVRNTNMTDVQKGTLTTTPNKNLSKQHVLPLTGCDPDDPSCVETDLIVTKHVINNNGGVKQASDFIIHIIGNNAFPLLFGGSEQSTIVAMSPGSYGVTETVGNGGYTSNFSPDCSGIINRGEVKRCVITNSDVQQPPSCDPDRPQCVQPAFLVITKHVINDYGITRQASDFSIHVNGNQPNPNLIQGSEGGTIVSLLPGSYSVAEDAGVANYTSSFSQDCSGTISSGETKTCIVYNILHHGTRLLLNPISSVPWGKPVTVTGRLIDDSLGNGVQGKTIYFGGNGAPSINPVLTRSDGTFSASGVAPSIVFPDWNVQAHFSGDIFFQPSDSAAMSYATVKHHVMLSMPQTGNVPWGTPIHLTAILTDVDNSGAAISGRTIDFSATTPGLSLGSGQTNSLGIAVFDGTAPNSVLPCTTICEYWRVISKFAGDNLYESGESNEAKFRTLPHSTSLSLILTPNSVVHSGAYSINGRLMDTITNMPVISKTITFTASPPITISPLITNNIGQYKVLGLTAPNIPRSYNIQAHFAGDTMYSQVNSGLRILTVS